MANVTNIPSLPIVEIGDSVKVTNNVQTLEGRRFHPDKHNPGIDDYSEDAKLVLKSPLLQTMLGTIEDRTRGLRISGVQENLTNPKLEYRLKFVLKDICDRTYHNKDDAPFKIAHMHLSPLHQESNTPIKGPKATVFQGNEIAVVTSSSVELKAIHKGVEYIITKDTRVRITGSAVTYRGSKYPFQKGTNSAFYMVQPVEVRAVRFHWMATEGVARENLIGPLSAPTTT